MFIFFPVIVYRALSSFDVLYTFKHHLTICFSLSIARRVSFVFYTPRLYFSTPPFEKVFYKDNNTVIDDFSLSFSNVCLWRWSPTSTKQYQCAGFSAGQTVGFWSAPFRDGGSISGTVQRWSASEMMWREAVCTRWTSFLDRKGLPVGNSLSQGTPVRWNKAPLPLAPLQANALEQGPGS